MHRFFAPGLDAGDEIVTLPRDEAEHLRRVLRLGVGDAVAVFDGRGHEFLARVASVVRRDVRLQIQSRVEPPPEPTVALTLAQAVLKGDKMDDVVRDGVMLGVAAIQPIVTKRTETTVAALIRSARVERWRRVALASVKQSRRAVLPDVRTPLTFENFLEEPAASLRLMLVEPSNGGGNPVSRPQYLYPGSQDVFTIKNGGAGVAAYVQLAPAHLSGARFRALDRVLLAMQQRLSRKDPCARPHLSVSCR